MPYSKNKAQIITVVSGLLLVGVFFYILTSRRIPEIPLLPSEEIDVEGMIICLPHKNTNGPQTLECAFGLQDREGKYYTLRDSDPGYKNIYGVPANVMVEVQGVFTPQNDSKYQSIGVIDVTSITRIDIPQRMTLSGTYVCLPYKDPNTPHDDVCKFGIKTDSGLYYALDFNLSSQTPPVLQEGDRISASGVFTRLELLSTDIWDVHPIEGIFSVTDSFKKL